MRDGVSMPDACAGETVDMTVNGVDAARIAVGHVVCSTEVRTVNAASPKQIADPHLFRMSLWPGSNRRRALLPESLLPRLAHLQHCKCPW